MGFLEEERQRERVFFYNFFFLRDLLSVVEFMYYIKPTTGIRQNPLLLDAGTTFHTKRK